MRQHTAGVNESDDRMMVKRVEGLQLNNKSVTVATWQKLTGAAMLVLLLAVDLRLILAAYEPATISLWLIFLFYPIFVYALFLGMVTHIRAIRIITEILLFSAIYTDSVYVILSSYPFSLPDAINIRNNTGYASGAVFSFAKAFLISFPLAAVIFGCLKWMLKSVRLKVSSMRFAWGMMASSAAFLYGFFNPGFFDFTPSAFRLTGNLITAFSYEPESRWQRSQVVITPGKNTVKHLVFVMDESVSGNALSINGYPKETTPFLSANANKYTNFGIATAFTNFSSGSNLALIAGLRKRNLPDEKYVAFEKPTIFQYAKKAGYRTILLNGQTPAGERQNYLAHQDLESIDSVLWVGPEGTIQNPVYSTDSVIANSILRLSASAEPTFVFVNKSGAHWPYQSNYPEEMTDRITETTALHNSDVFTFAALQANPNASEYLNSVKWNVDQFMSLLITGLSGNNNTLVVYTSDHGENFDAGAYTMRHAAVYNASAQEGLVPLIMIDRGNFLPANFTPRKNNFSHENIFPTLLEAMGYKKNQTSALYGESLTDTTTNSTPWFLTGDIFGRGKNNRIYTSSHADLPSANASSTESFNWSEASPK